MFNLYRIGYFVYHYLIGKMYQATPLYHLPIKCYRPSVTDVIGQVTDPMHEVTIKGFMKSLKRLEARSFGGGGGVSYNL